MTIDLDDIESRINDGIYGVAQMSDADRDDAFSALAELLAEVERLRLDRADIEHAYNFARDKAKLLERQAVVAWLREEGSINSILSPLKGAADEIERGEHRRGEEK
jgi:hypothetical protein